MTVCAIEPRYRWSERDLDAFIEAWHRAHGPHLRRGEAGVALHEYLGWTWEEYGRWVETCEQPGEAGGLV